MKGTTEARILTELQIALVLVFYEQLKNQKTVVYWSPEREIILNLESSSHQTITLAGYEHFQQKERGP